MSEIEELKKLLETGFNEMDKHFEEITEELKNVNGRIDEVEKKLNKEK